MLGGEGYYTYLLRAGGGSGEWSEIRLLECKKKNKVDSEEAFPAARNKKRRQEKAMPLPTCAKCKHLSRCCNGYLCALDDLDYDTGCGCPKKSCLATCKTSGCRHPTIFCPEGYSLVDYQDGGEYCPRCQHMVLTDCAPCSEACGCAERSESE